MFILNGLSTLTIQTTARTIGQPPVPIASDETKKITPKTLSVSQQDQLQDIYTKYRNGLNKEVPFNTSLKNSIPGLKNVGLTTPFNGFLIPDYSDSRRITLLSPIIHGKNEPRFNTSTTSETKFEFANTINTITQNGEFKLSKTAPHGYYSIKVEYNNKDCIYNFFSEPDLNGTKLTLNPGSSDIVPQLGKTLFYLVKGPRVNEKKPYRIGGKDNLKLDYLEISSSGHIQVYNGAYFGDYCLLTGGGQMVTLSVNPPDSVTPQPTSTPNKEITPDTVHQIKIPPPAIPSTGTIVGKIPIKVGDRITIESPFPYRTGEYRSFTVNDEGALLSHGLDLKNTGEVLVMQHIVPFTYKITVNQKDTYILEIKR